MRFEQPSNFFYFVSLLLFVVLTLAFSFQEHPVVLVVALVATLLKQFFEHCPHSRIARPLVKTEVPAVAEVFTELHWIALT